MRVRDTHLIHLHSTVPVYSEKAARRRLQLKETRGNYLERIFYLTGALRIDRGGPRVHDCSLAPGPRVDAPSLPDQLGEAR